ncbi:hypothetical protein ACQKF0_09385 [Bacillus wiedmannii]|uniref:hypothetical protein n=1 Tax=Bacillus wiedmannii TaxID=1890302 RepID=UPI003CE68699
MNTQAAIEAAKIAAETAQRNSIITAVVAILTVLITVLITSAITIRTARKSNKLAKELGEKNLKALEQRRYIDAISAERVKWISELREKSSEFLKVTHLQVNDFRKWYETDISKINQDVLMERSSEIVGLSNQIYLLLNPHGIANGKLITLQNEVAVILSNSNIREFNLGELEEKIIVIGYLYQVILKAEWKRIKEGNKVGAELSEERVNEIYIEVARKYSAIKFL